MSEKKDVYSKAKSQMRLSERIASFIPGFRGYKEKELRRESDKLIRNHLHLKLSTIKTDLKTTAQRLADRRYLDVLTDMDRLIAKMDRVVDKVDHASYGYTGFFDVVKVKEENLDRMITFDAELIEEASSLAAEVATFKNQLHSGETKNLKAQIQNLADKISLFEETFDKRSEAILGVT